MSNWKLNCKGNTKWLSRHEFTSVWRCVEHFQGEEIAKVNVNSLSCSCFRNLLISTTKASRQQQIKTNKRLQYLYFFLPWVKRFKLERNNLYICNYFIPQISIACFFNSHTCISSYLLSSPFIPTILALYATFNRGKLSHENFRLKSIYADKCHNIFVRLIGKLRLQRHRVLSRSYFILEAKRLHN